MPSATKSTHGDGHFPQRLKNFFRITSGSRDRDSGSQAQLASQSYSSHSSNVTHHSSGNNNSSSTGSKLVAIRQTKFFSVGRSRSGTTASEGNPLEETLSPTAHANPYFQHQGQPALRHHEEGSVPPSPPDTPGIKIEGPDGGNAENVKASTKEELARKLRRVASAPNAQGLFKKGASGADKEPLPEGAIPAKDPKAAKNDEEEPPDGLEPASETRDALTPLPPPSQSNLAFRRTYSSNSIKVRDVEVGPQSFEKIKLIGKGDVGKVYLVREKKSGRLYAMKGQFILSTAGRAFVTNLRVHY